MFLIERILVPVDFSERSRGAARYAEALADRDRTEISLVHVASPLRTELSTIDAGLPAFAEVNESTKAELKRDLDRFASEEFAGYQVQCYLLDGDPAQHIVALAHEQRSSLIVMPTHGYGMFRRFLLGSVTAKVLHDAGCPVWTGVHLEDSPPVERIHIRKILVAIDLCPAQALKALSWAAQLAEQTKAEMLIAHAYPSLEGRAGEIFDPSWRTYFSDMATEEIVGMQRKLGLNAEVVTDAGDPARVVSNLAALHNVDLVVIGRGSAAGVFGRLRANAYAIIRQSPCPVVSV